MSLTKRNADEEEPLLSNDNINANESFVKVILTELLILLKIAIPVILTNLSAFLLLTESIIMTGHLTKYDFDASSLANSILNVAGIAVGIGLCTACDTYFSQMFSSKHKMSIGMILQKAVMVISLFPIILLALHINMEPIFILLKQEPTVARKAARYMIMFSPGLIFAFNYLILTRYLQSQNKVLPPMIIGIFVNIVNVTSQYISIYHFNLGLDASAICQAIAFFLFWFIQLLYIIITKTYEDTWNAWTKDSFLEWGEFSKLAIPGAAMVVLECFCFEIGTLLSGIMGVVQLAAQSVLFQLETITFMISFGVGVAVNIRVGQALGAGKPQMALRSYRCGILMMIISFCITTSLLMSLRNLLPKLFTNDIESQILSTELIPFLIGVQFFDAIGTVTMGALRGCGRQKICVLIIFCSYYLLGQPIGISLAFAANMQVKGIWIGLMISLVICVPIAFIYTNFIQDWKIQAEICHKRVAKAALEEEKEQFVDYQDSNNMFLSTTVDLVSTDHKRSFSKSFTMKSADKILVSKMREVDDKLYRKFILRRIFIVSSALLILAAGVMVHIFLPKSYYRSNLTSEIP